MPSAKLLVFACEPLVCIKIVGRANVASSIDFKRLVTELMEKDLTCFVLDLSERKCRILAASASNWTAITPRGMAQLVEPGPGLAIPIKASGQWRKRLTVIGACGGDRA